MKNARYFKLLEVRVFRKCPNPRARLEHSVGTRPETVYQARSPREDQADLARWRTSTRSALFTSLFTFYHGFRSRREMSLRLRQAVYGQPDVQAKQRLGVLEAEGKGYIVRRVIPACTSALELRLGLAVLIGIPLRFKRDCPRSGMRAVGYAPVLGCTAS